ncbi:PadR family transcriptional regulator [Cellulosimicrobium arenosum]|uniref:Helix-turn-helix transcriptional regulator n=1 Tax=Cellulosimicrobium arenosum TaxID=2708133 RepID=A0A927J2F3_9MICO|nr:PadR family transcriptional regulator [Cellulosimicrobium arenosum]MBD8080699.1 helix-turn-helix transcriptional regulator [Cellulosimicrobium arenosum]
MATVFAHGQLRLYLLALLASGPKHGYELMTELSQRFGGTYRPSAGTIYPRLARLEEDGLVVRSEDGRKSTYELTPAGRAELAARRDDVFALEHDITETVRRRAQALRADVQGSLAGLRAELTAAARSARERPDASEGRRRDSARRRAEAEVALRRFRDEVRADLRRADASGAVTDVSLDTLRTVLDGARDAVRATLP